MSKAQRRAARAVEEPANRLLAGNEEVLAFTEAVEDAPILERAVLGAAWPGSRRAALLFTTRRLIEFSISASGRQFRGRIRSFPWDGIPGFSVEDGWLGVRTWEGERHRWAVRDLPDPVVEGRLLRRVNLAVSTYVPSQSRTAPRLHCSSCAAERPTSEDTCRKCDASVRTPRQASRLALATPGGGHFYARRPVAGLLRLLGESAVFGGLAAIVLGSGELWRVVLAVLAGVGILGVMKLHGMWSAQLLVARAGAISAAAQHRWRNLARAGLALSIAVLIGPLPFAGRLDRSITWDLRFADADSSWAATTASPGMQADHGAELRAAWAHNSGREVRATAWPFPITADADAVQAGLAYDRRITDPADRRGAFRVLRAVQPVIDQDGLGAVRVSLLVIDEAARDVHELASVVDATVADDAAAALWDLYERSYWVPAR